MILCIMQQFCKLQNKLCWSWLPALVSTCCQVFTAVVHREFANIANKILVLTYNYLSTLIGKDLPFVVKMELTLTYGHELWVLTNRIIQPKSVFSSGLSLRDVVRSSDIQRDLWVEPLLPPMERDQLRWLDHLVWMPPGCLPLEGFRTCSTMRTSQGRPRSCHLAREHLQIPQEELESIAGKRMSETPCLASCHHDLS